MTLRDEAYYQGPLPPIEPHDPHHLSAAQMRTIFLAVEVALPLAVFAMGLLMWWRRR